MSLRSILAGLAPGASRLREALAPGGPGTYDPDEGLTAAQGGSSYYKRLTQSPRDLAPIAHERLQEIAYHLWLSNPLAKQVIELTKDFVVGGGVEIRSTPDTDDTADPGAEGAAPKQKAPDPVQEVIDRFWGDPINAWELKLHDKVRELGLYGEQCWTVRVNPVDGHVRLGYVDPARIARIATDPLNPEVRLEVVLKADGGQEGERLKVIRIAEDPRDPWYGRMRGVATDTAGVVLDTYRVGPPPGPDATDDRPERAYLGACFFYAVNKVTNATRGSSDLAPLADWIDAVDQLQMNQVDRALLLLSLVWDVTLQGADATAVNTYVAEHGGAPKPGSVRVHNDTVKWEPLSPNLNADDSQAGIDGVVSYIATGAGFSKTWLNGTTGVNRATATEMSDPAWKRITARQTLVRHILAEVFTFALDQAEMAGVLPRRDTQSPKVLSPVPWTFEVSMPEIRPKDLKAAFDAAAVAVTAMMGALTEHLVDRETATSFVAMAIRETGLDVDLDAMLAKIEVERRAAQAEADAMLAQAHTLPGDGGPTPPGAGGSPGDNVAPGR